jgi:hypothetical protein
MKNYDKFEQKLQETDRIPAPGPERADSGLLKLRLDLKQATNEDHRRSQFHQSTAWTRLEARMDDRPAGMSFGRILSYLTTAAVAVVVTAALMSRGGDGADGLPQISGSKPGIYATPFYSEGAQADVIWAEGYQYIPANYSY